MSFRRALVLWASLVVVAAASGCGGDANQPTGGSNSGGSGGDGGATGGGGTGGSGGGSTGCPAGSHGTLPACSADLKGWTPGSGLATARDHHVTFAATTSAGTTLYVAGGTDGFSILTSIEAAKILDDGSLGPFGAAAAELPEGLAGAGFAQVGNSVVLGGGLMLSGGMAVSGKDTFVGTVADDGTLSFSKGPELLTDRYHVSMSTDRGYVYAIGGLRQFYTGGNPMQSVSDAVERASFDGKTLGTFEALDPLPHALTHQAAVVRDHVLYLVGGLETEAVLTDILRADLDEKGDIGAWKSAGSLPQGRATSAAFVFLDQLYVLCGSTQAQGGEVDTVLRASFAKDGSLGKFEELAHVPMVRAHVHQTPLVNGFIYSAGGSGNGMFENQVFVGALQ